ncbi:MAG: DUF1850 domain-containing protein [Bifidobacteriaceae bacterium]|nr:DUF1850 domain-containing protein [Bifidobacteriaceae bacterium]
MGFAVAAGASLGVWASQPVLRIEQLPDAAVPVSDAAPVLTLPVAVGDELVFGWEHSLERIPWDEFYHIGSGGELILDTIRFAAFGAGIPAAKGAAVWTEGGLIHLGEIGEAHSEIVWINSTTATKDLRLNGQVIARGRDLPAGRRLRLSVGPRCGARAGAGAGAEGRAGTRAGAEGRAGTRAGAAGRAGAGL